LSLCLSSFMIEVRYWATLTEIAIRTRERLTVSFALKDRSLMNKASLDFVAIRVVHDLN
jgi:hypothetical protein